MFYHLDPVPDAAANLGVGDGRNDNGEGRLVATIQVPVLDTQGWGAEWVEWGTVVVVLLGFLWVAWKLWVGSSLRIASSDGRERGATSEDKAEKEKKQQ